VKGNVLQESPAGGLVADPGSLVLQAAAGFGQDFPRPAV
jgi:hypothetical protein